MRIHPEVTTLLKKIAAAGRPAFADTPPNEIRAYQAKIRVAKGPGPNIRSTEDVLVPGSSEELRARIYRPTDTPIGMILYFHGGGWTIGSVDHSDTTCRKLALASGCLVSSIEYRLAPEHPFPAAFDDAAAALAWAVDNRSALLGEADAPLIVMGESAGGNIALAALIEAEGLCDRITLLVLIYPVVDCDLDTASYLEYAQGTLLTRWDMRWFWNNYCPDAVQRADPRLSPLRAAQLSHLPATLVVSAECDPLLSEGLALVECLAVEGVPVQHLCYAGMVHGFFSLSDDLTDGQRAIEDVTRIIRENLDKNP